MTDEQFKKLTDKLDIIIDKQSKIEAQLEKLEVNIESTVHDIKKIKKRIKKNNSDSEEKETE